MSFHFLEIKRKSVAFSAFSLLWNWQPHQVCCFNSVNSRVGGPEVPSDITAVTVVSNMNCRGLHCHADRPYLIPDHFFGPLKQQLGGSRFHCNEEVEVAVCE